MNENVDDTVGLNEEQVDEMLKEKDARANAQILEMVCYFDVGMSY